MLTEMLTYGNKYASKGTSKGTQSIFILLKEQFLYSSFPSHTTFAQQSVAGINE